MYPWNKVPVLRAIIPFIMGIIFYLTIQLNVHIIHAIFMVVFLGILIFLLKNDNFKKRWLIAMILYVLLFCCGVLIIYVHNQPQQPGHFSKYILEKSFILVRISDRPEEKKETFSTTIKVLCIMNGNRIIPCNGKALIYFKKDRKAATLKYGDLIIVKNNFKCFQPPLNPGQFDFKTYLADKQIVNQIYVKSNQWLNTGFNNSNKIYSDILKIRYSIVNVYKSSFPDQDQNSVLNSLVIGYRSGISSELLESFVDTGTIHILSVSGLHVGIVYIIFVFLLFPLKKVPYGGQLTMIFLIIMLWLYSILTGMEPSVCRSALMLTFVIIGKNIKRNSNMYSSIFTSAIILLLINPYILKQLGFQLSYAAVLGIIIIHPVIYPMLEFNNLILNKIWGLISVSLSAQALTFPLSIYYFNQFPLYFIPANIITIPVSTLIIYFALIFLLIKSIGLTGIATLCCKILSFQIVVMGKFLEFLKNLPYAVMDGLFLNVISVLLIYFLVFMLIIWIVKKRKFYLLISVGTLTLLLCLMAFHKFNNLNNRAFTVHSYPNTNLISFTDGNKAFLYGDSNITWDPDIIKNIMYRDFCKKGISKSNIIRLSRNKNFVSENLFISRNYFQYFNKKLLLIDEKNCHNILLINNLHVDLVIISGSASFDFDQLMTKLFFKQLIFESSGNYCLLKKWKDICDRRGIKYYDVKENGAFILKI